MTTAALSSPKDYAMHYTAEYGFSVFVLRNHEAGTESELKDRKKPAINWELYQIMRASQIQIERWFSKNPNYNVAVATGGISNYRDRCRWQHSSEKNRVKDPRDV
jgi:Bifunctional DNA primase/polymerase, N-terminal